MESAVGWMEEWELEEDEEEGRREEEEQKVDELIDMVSFIRLFFRQMQTILETGA